MNATTPGLGLRVIIVVTSLTLLQCARNAGVSARRPQETSPTAPADDCRALSDVSMLERVPRSRYDSRIKQSDDGIRRLATLWPPVGRFTEVMLPSQGDQRTPLRFGNPSMGFDTDRNFETIFALAYWCTFSAVFFQRELAAADVHCTWDTVNVESRCIANRYKAIFAQLGMSVGDAEASARREFADVLARMHRTRLLAMGEPIDYELSPSRETPKRLAAAEHVLSDPLARLAVGSIPGGVCSTPFNPMPAGFKEAKELVDAKAVNALRRVLRGPNPEARGFAALGLTTLNALSENDVRVIERIKDASHITTQGGCTVAHGPAGNFFSNLKLQANMFDPGALQ